MSIAQPLVSPATFDVAVVGFGPSGAVAAGLLGGFGLTVFVCDRQRDVYDKPRAIALDHEILRVFQQLGVVDRVLPHTEPFTDSHYHGAGGALIKILSTVAPPYPLGYAPSSVFSQPPVEALLRAHAASLPGVEVALGSALRSLSQDDDGVTLDLVDGAGAARTVRARYVVGCDGASSTVRELAGIGLEDLAFDEPWLVVDALVNERGLAKLPTTSVQYCEPGRPCSLVIGPGNHRRWEISLHADEDPKAAATEAGTWKLLSRWLTPDDARLWRQASYRFHALVAERWRAGRVFIAGDAAHQQPPFLGQGMCQGVRDVANLAWKLDAVLRGRAGDALLDSYGEERGLHVRQLTGRIKAIGAVICERDPAQAEARDARLLAEAGGHVRPTPRQDVLPRLEAGLIDGSGHAAVGTIFPQPWLLEGGERVRFDAVVGCGWRFVIGAAAEGFDLPSATLDALRRLCVALVHVVDGVQSDASAASGSVVMECDGVLARWFERHGCLAALVRPDHCVYGVGDDAPALQAVVESLGRRLDVHEGESRASRGVVLA